MGSLGNPRLHYLPQDAKDLTFIDDVRECVETFPEHVLELIFFQNADLRAYIKIISLNSHINFWLHDNFTTTPLSLVGRKQSLLHQLC